MKRGGWLEERGSKRTTTGGSGRALGLLGTPHFGAWRLLNTPPLLCLAFGFALLCFAWVCFGLVWFWWWFRG